MDDLLRRVRAVSEEQRELDRHSFVIKLWVEEVISGQTKWRGHITHVSTEERRYVERLEDVTEFIHRYLIAMGAR